MGLQRFQNGSIITTRGFFLYRGQWDQSNLPIIQGIKSHQFCCFPGSWGGASQAGRIQFWLYHAKLDMENYCIDCGFDMSESSWDEDLHSQCVIKYPPLMAPEINTKQSTRASARGYAILGWDCDADFSGICSMAWQYPVWTVLPMVISHCHVRLSEGTPTRTDVWPWSCTQKTWGRFGLRSLEISFSDSLVPSVYVCMYVCMYVGR